MGWLVTELDGLWLLLVPAVPALVRVFGELRARLSCWVAILGF